MTNEVYPVFIDLVKPPSAIDAGSGFTLMLAIESDAPCDLAKARVEVFDGDSLRHQCALGQLIRFDPQSPDFDPRNGPVERRDQASLSLTAPQAIGSFQWRILLPAQDIEGVALSQASCEFRAQTQGHRCSLVVWDAASPIQASAVVRFKVGGKCSAGCNLQGQRLRVCQTDGDCVAEPVLQMAHQEAEGLWWGESVFTAPVLPGLSDYQVQFAPGEMNGAPHAAGQTQFSILVTEAPDHFVHVAVIDAERGVGIEDAHVRIGVHRIATDSNGAAAARVSTGEHRIFVWKAGFDIPEQSIMVDKDLELTITALAMPAKDPYERWQG